MEIFCDSVLHNSATVSQVVLGVFAISLTIATVFNFVEDVHLYFKYNAVNGFVLMVLLVSLGYLLTWTASEKNFNDHFQNYYDSESFFEATIVDPPLEKAKVLSVVAEVNQLFGKQGTVKVRGNILLNILRDSTADKLRYGDKIVFKARVEPFDEPKNPGEFSFKLYQSFHNIFHRAFLKQGDWKRVARDKGNVFIATSHKTRKYFLSLLRKYVSDANNFGVASSIMLGYKDYRNADVTRAYASSGALHVLSVSGLHVGIIFFILNGLFGWMDSRGRNFLVAKSIVIIILIWFYACLTGLYPSVLRSATMFTMIQIGMLSSRGSITYNVIAMSALVLIAVNPFIVTEVGFRLSYLAVIGIIFLQPKIYSLLAFKNWLLDKAWMIIAVSLAAQIATFPLGLYYFHQFPILFLISNLVVIPAGYLILCCGIALFAFGEVPYLNDITGWTFDLIISLLNRFIFFIDSLSFALINGISITMIEMILIYVIILLICYVTEERRIKVVIAVLVIVFGLTAFNSYENLIHSRQKKVIVYSVPKSKALAFITGKRVLYDFDNALLANESSMLFHVRHNWWSYGIKEESPVDHTYINQPIGRLLDFEGSRILLIDSSIGKLHFTTAEKLKVDLVILSHNSKIKVKDLIQHVDCSNYVFDSSNKEWRTRIWKKDCIEQKINYWDVSEKGAFVRER